MIHRGGTAKTKRLQYVVSGNIILSSPRFYFFPIRKTQQKDCNSMGLNKPLLADKLVVVSLLGVEREEDASA